MKRLVTGAATISVLLTTFGMLSASAQNTDTIQLGPRPFFLVENMDPGELQDTLRQCEAGSDVSIAQANACDRLVARRFFLIDTLPQKNESPCSTGALWRKYDGWGEWGNRFQFCFPFARSMTRTVVPSWE